MCCCWWNRILHPGAATSHKCNGVLLAFGRTSNQILLLLVHILDEIHLLLFLVNYVVLECYY
ncbi:hypothetical protein PVAP13_7KG054009 [Panicum virgatum]|uniref:Uncharacterized protein n=1 Tax=Panicum virgatum TaxID=38727 RepID=A0A8T0QCI3_PANVG|nr:hypothetical protein PVAP13_7KG054009 [Panicum virgatum]